MSFSVIVNTALANAGVSWEWFMIIIVTLGSFVMFAKDFKVGIITLMVSHAGLFIWFYQSGYDYTKPLGIFFMALVILVLSIYAVDTSSSTGGIGG